MSILNQTGMVSDISHTFGIVIAIIIIGLILIAIMWVAIQLR